MIIIALIAMLACFKSPSVREVSPRKPEWSHWNQDGCVAYLLQPLMSLTFANPKTPRPSLYGCSSEPKSKARAHPGETHASWVMRGAAALAQSQTVHYVGSFDGLLKA